MTHIKKYKKLPVELIADYFIWKANQENKPITNKKLQKLLYYSQAWSIVINKHPLFKEKIEAWVHGPAVRSVYFNFREFGFHPIKKDVLKKNIRGVNEKMKKFLDEIWKVYGKHDAQYLELLTHNEKPWQEARQGLGASESSDNEISLDMMKEYYSSLLKNGNSRN
jgi:uncharacterized phage-associated protein